MALLELKVSSVINDGAQITASVVLFARNTPTTTVIGKNSQSLAYPRIILRSGSFAASNASDLRQLIRDKVVQFYQNLTPQQQAMVTGICPEQS